MQSSRRPGVRRRLTRAVLSSVLGGSLCLPAPVRGGDEDRNLTLPGDKDTILQVEAEDRWARMALQAAIAGAFRRLGSPECQRVLTDFADRGGRPLQAVLEATGQSAPRYLGLLRYSDGQRQALCRRGGVLAFTSPGTRIVYICGRFTDKFLSLRLSEREDLELAVIHEILHTLGLPEDPPSAEEITDRVRRRCGER